MKSFFACLMLVSMLVSLCSAAVTCAGNRDPKNMLVSAAWLSGHLQDPDLVVVAVGPRADYEKAHITGAQYLDLSSVAAKDGKLTLELPPMAELAQTFRSVGVSNNSHVVLYAMSNQIQSATRVFLTLDAMGMGAKTSLLDGGLPLWQNESRAVTTDIRAAHTGNVEPCAQTDVIADAQYVRSNLEHKGVNIVDARLPGFYTGAQIPNGQRAGHMPGAVNIPYISLVDDLGKFKPVPVLAEMFKSAGISPGDQVVSYCHVGQQATAVYFAARLLGYDARMYDGSWQEWSAHTEFPVVTSAPATAPK